MRSVRTSTKMLHLSRSGVQTKPGDQDNYCLHRLKQQFAFSHLYVQEICSSLIYYNSQQRDENNFYITNDILRLHGKRSTVRFCNISGYCDCDIESLLICVKWCPTHILLSFWFCYTSSCVPHVVSFSGLSIFDCPFGILLRVFNEC